MYAKWHATETLTIKRQILIVIFITDFVGFKQTWRKASDLIVFMR